MAIMNARATTSSGYRPILLGILAALVVLTLGTFGTASTANASPRPADVMQTSTAQDFACPYNYFCAYSQPNYGGGINLYPCGVLAPVPWTGYGSYINNSGSWVTLIGQWIQFPVAPGEANPYFNWSSVYWMQIPC